MLANKEYKCKVWLCIVCTYCIDCHASKIHAWIGMSAYQVAMQGRWSLSLTRILPFFCDFPKGIFVYIDYILQTIWVKYCKQFQLCKQIILYLGRFLFLIFLHLVSDTNIAVVEIVLPLYVHQNLATLSCHCMYVKIWPHLVVSKCTFKPFSLLSCCLLRIFWILNKCMWTPFTLKSP